MALTARASPPGRAAGPSGRACCSGSRWRPSSTRWCSSGRCCCSACGRAGCGSSGPRPGRRRLAWLAVNLPVMIAAPVRLGPLLRVQRGPRAPTGARSGISSRPTTCPCSAGPRSSTLNMMSAGVFAVACAPSRVLALAAPRRPRLPQLCFLVLAAFLLTNKVWSPQYVIWLVPLAVLARPRLWRLPALAAGRGGLLLRRSGATSSSSTRPGPSGDRLSGHQHRAGTSPPSWPGSSPWPARRLVVRDILHPERDPVRALGA